MSVPIPRTITAALVAAALALAGAPARSADSATADDTARYLAGMPPSLGSPLAGMTLDGRWQQHARHFDATFGRNENAELSKIRAFSQQRMPDKHDTLLYTFSGPDFLYASAFFPTASTYILAGLEQVGDVPPLTSLSRGTVDQTLQSLEISLDTILNYSFFITHNMKTQLYNGPVSGTLPILYIFLARTGKTIHEVSFVGLDEAGNLVGPGVKNAASKGVRIIFSSGTGSKQTLYYFATNLADDSISRTGFLQFCAKFGPTDSFIKSASYLLQTGRFNKVRDFLLDHSATVLQDDTGIPLSHFDPKAWRFQAFGHYSGPLNISGATYQQRMGELFRSAIPLDFGVGYRWRPNESNLIIAQKIAARTSSGELAPRLPTDRYPRNAVGASQSGSSSQSARRRVESEPTTTLGCGIPGIFSFCTGPQAKTNP
jgi:hypothetical protein